MKKLLVLPFLALVFVGCHWGPGLGTGPSDLAQAAAVIASYRQQDELAGTANLEAQDAAGDDVVGKSVTTSTHDYALPDGTTVHVTKVLDDRGTPTPEDDVLTITREWVRADGNTMTERIVRPLKPSLDWTGWSGDLLVQDGTTETFLGGVKIASGTIRITWSKAGGTVHPAEIVREASRVDRGGAIERITVVCDATGDQLSKTMLRIRLDSDGHEIIVHSFTFERIVVDGVTRTKMTRDDGSWLVVMQERGPRIVEYYRPDGTLASRAEEAVDRSTGEHRITRTYYDAEGNALRTIQVVLVICVDVDGDGARIVVTQRSDGTVRQLTIREEEEGWWVDRAGVVYHVRLNGSAVEFYDSDGNLIGAVTVNPDGSWQVTQPDGTSVTVSAG